MDRWSPCLRKTKEVRDVLLGVTDVSNEVWQEFITYHTKRLNMLANSGVLKLGYSQSAEDILQDILLKLMCSGEEVLDNPTNSKLKPYFIFYLRCNIRGLLSMDNVSGCKLLYDDIENINDVKDKLFYSPAMEVPLCIKDFRKDLKSKLCCSREYMVVILRFFNFLTLDEVGDYMSISGNRIHQLEYKALRRLREHDFIRKYRGLLEYFYEVE